MAWKRIETVQTVWQKLEVWGTKNCREFRAADAIHAWWKKDHYLTGLAWDNLAAASLLHPGEPPKSILMLGVAGGTTLRTLHHLLPDCQLTGVEIDPEILSLAEKYMDLKAVPATIHIADAYTWVAQRKRKFDVIIDDCYLAGEDDVYRAEQDLGGLIKLLKQHLQPTGILVMNLVTGAGHRRVQSRARAVFRAVFPHVKSITTPDSANEALIGGTKLGGAPILRRQRELFPTAIDKNYWNRLRLRTLHRLR